MNLRIATSEMMRKIDSYCINELKIPGIILMENAALKVVKNLELDKYNSFCIVCIKGNNGGDGFAVARHLTVLKKTVSVFLLGNEDDMSNDCRINYEILKNMGITINRINNNDDINVLRDSVEKSQVTIDAIFGTGLSREVQGIFALVISTINESSKNIISIDIPSGLDSNVGRILGNSIRANKTISFQLYKRGFLNYDAKDLIGNVVIEDIGIPEAVIKKFHNSEFMMEEAVIRKSIKMRDNYSHKGDYGKVFIVAGSGGFTGAAYICAQGAVRSGAGLVTLCCSEEIQPILSSKLVEAMTMSFNQKEKIEEMIEKSDVIAIGPGMGNNEVTYELLQQVINNSTKPVVIDADGINGLKNRVDILKNRKCEVIITPHLGEMARITGLSIDYIKENRIEVSKKFARDYKVIVLLKGYNTVITDGNTTIINPTGNSAMASGGMGDCLTGMISSFIGQGYEPMKATYIAAFIHGYCGEELSKRMFCVNASHILEQLPFTIKKLTGEFIKD